MIEYGEHFTSEMRSLTAQERGTVMRKVREIATAPWTERAGRIELPPMWAPGTYEEKIGPFTIRYCRFMANDVEGLRFLHVNFATFGGFDAM